MARFADGGPRGPDQRIAPHRLHAVESGGLDDFDAWDLVNRVMDLWDKRLDTAAIAQKLFQKESAVATALRIGRERRRSGDWRTENVD